jgi:hypothetical protein
MGYPSSFPVDFQLGSHEPRVSQDDFVVTQVRQEVSECPGLQPSPHGQVGVVSEVACLVRGSVDVKQFPGFFQGFDWQVECHRSDFPLNSEC